MKLTMKEVQSKMSASWGRRAVVIAYRTAGNKYRYAVSDHVDHWIPLDSSWVGGCQVFEPSDGSWPEPKQTTWGDAVLAASQRARAYFWTKAIAQLSGGCHVPKSLPRARTGNRRETRQTLG